jgi:hypothetical protein
MYDGTLATNGPWEALVAFQQMLVLGNESGEVDMTPAAISRVTTIPQHIIEKGIAALCAPDPDSRTPDEGGRRLVLLSGHRTWGWRIVNYVKYRQLQREADRRDYHRNYYHQKRKSPDETQHVSTDSTNSTDTETNTEAEANTKKRSSTAAQAQTLPPFTGDADIASINPKARVLIAKAWELPIAWGEDAEKLGWKPGQIIKESEKYRQYWTDGKGAGTRRTIKGWRQAWSNWLSKAERYAA